MSDEIRAAFRAGFMAGTKYDWDYRADGQEEELCAAEWAKFNAALTTPCDPTADDRG